VSAVVVLAPLLAAFWGVRGPFTLALHFGPGDFPYIEGFTREYEIKKRVATHWTTSDARVSLPMTVSGGPLALSYRLARVLPQTATVEVFFGDTPVDQFKCRGGVVLERRVNLGTLTGAPLDLRFKISSRDQRNLGVELDWVRFEGGEAARARLRGAARWRPAGLALLLLLIFIGAGWGAQGALVASPFAAALTAGLVRDPWLTHRLLRGIPEATLGLAVLGLGFGWWLRARGRLSPETLRILALLGCVAFLLRAAAVNHPDFYYPDLKTHASLVDVVRRAGFEFLRAPAAQIWKQGLWRTEAYGQTYAFPYSPAFHVPFAFLSLPLDQLILAMKLTGAALTLVPLFVVWALARRMGAFPLGAVLMVLIPTYATRLSFAFLAALYGHAFDMALIYWLCGNLPRLQSPRVWLVGAAFVAACELSYISSVMNISILVFALALLDPWDRSQGVRQAVLILGMGVAGSLLAIVLYYRDFLGMVFDLVPRMLAESARASRYPIQGYLSVVYSRTTDFFDTVYPFLAATGLSVFLRGKVERQPSDASTRGLLLAWVAAYLLLLLGRAKAPDLFLHGHETLFVTPLVCLGAGHALGWLASRNPLGRVSAGLLLVLLAVQGLRLQWLAFAAQMGNAF
jgi:hypothetical protein